MGNRSLTANNAQLIARLLRYADYAKDQGGTVVVDAVTLRQAAASLRGDPKHYTDSGFWTHEQRA